MRTHIFAALASLVLIGQAQAQQAGQAPPAQAPGQLQAPGQGQPAGQRPANPAQPELKTVKDKASYGIGLNIGNNMKRLGFDLDLNAVLRGMADALSGAQPAVTPEEIQTSIATVQQEAQTRQQEEATKLADRNKQEGQAFLAQNKQQQGVTTLPSGLQIKVLKAGTGQVSPKPTDRVTTHYKGTLLDGTVFDSSYSRNEPATFGVSQVIPGWTEALQKMKAGDRWQLVVPSELAYGERGTPGGPIGPNATLIFEVELISIEQGQDK